MEYRQLGNTEIEVSLIGLGTMTWGEQNTEAEGHEQLDYALEAGINLIDTAELYPVPPKKATYGETERIIGTWLQKKRCRDQVILASKVAGPTARGSHIRGGNACFDRANLTEALENSLQRLQTDYLDLYQLHWPDRKTNYFGKRGYTHEEEDHSVSIEETLAILKDFQQQGKVRHFGISNETPWGTMKFIHCAQTMNLPQMVSIQNPYNLLNRTFESGLAEIAHREQIGLLAYSPLAFGMLSGKYLNQQKPENARLTLFSRFNRYQSSNNDRATKRYHQLAKKHGLIPSQMALAFVNSRTFLTSNLIGATTMKQLQSNIESSKIQLSTEVLAEIDAIHEEIPNPAP